ncbi:MAG: hypothetical protein K6C68_10075 [Ruminococcus sp.]|nr:hypothetical protein [Ruminococcus sp.]
MKRAEMNTNTGAKAIDIIKKYTDNVIIRMSDFYPERVGDQEYCMVSKAVYSELLKFKALEDDPEPTDIAPDNTPTVIINISDFYPGYDSKEDYKEVTREEYNILMAINMPYAVGYSDCGMSYKVVVMTKDFYPFLCTENEYTELEGKTYEMLVNFKAENGSDTENHDKFVSEMDETADINDNYDECNLDDVDEESVEIYEEMLKYKKLDNEYKASADNDTVRIRLSDFYPDNCSEEEYCDVSREVYEELMKNKRDDHAQRVKNARHLINADFDEIQCGEMYGIVTESNTRNILAALWMKEIMLPKGDELYRRSLMYYVQGLSVGEMAKIEGVEKYAIYASIRKMNRIVHNAAKGLFNSTLD